MLVRAIIVNHNTSLFSQLALRSLLWSHDGDEGIDLTVSVVDNHSSDEDLAALKDACDSLGATFSLSRWPLAESKLNTHGDVLRDFVLTHEDAEQFLFVDTDIDFEEQGTVTTMTAEVAADDDVWAVQARFRWAEENRGEGASLDIGAGSDIALKVGRASARLDETKGFDGTIQRRCHPGATLCPNSPLFRRVAEHVGFSTAARVSADTQHAGFFDTFGLASAAMTAAGKRYVLSRATVHHFFTASYDDEYAAKRKADCVERLERFERR